MNGRAAPRLVSLSNAFRTPSSTRSDPSHGPRPARAVASGHVSHAHGSDHRMNKTVYKGKEYDIYSYTEFAIDTKAEWNAWAEKYHESLKLKDLRKKQAEFEHVQIAIYGMLDEPKVDNSRYFKTRLEKKLKEVAEELTPKDFKNAFEFYIEKKDRYDALVMQANANRAQAHVARDAAKRNEVLEGTTRMVERKKEEYYSIASKGAFCTVAPTAALGLLSTGLIGVGYALVGGLVAGGMAWCQAKYDDDAFGSIARVGGYCVSKLTVGTTARHDLAVAKASLEEEKKRKHEVDVAVEYARKRQAVASFHVQKAKQADTHGGIGSSDEDEADDDEEEQEEEENEEEGEDSEDSSEDEANDDIITGEPSMTMNWSVR